MNQEKKPFQFDYEQSRQQFASDQLITVAPALESYNPPPPFTVIPDASADKISSDDAESEHVSYPSLVPQQDMKGKPSENVHAHLDPISVSLQERVKFGGHITSTLEESTSNGPFLGQNFGLKEVGK